jgi:hypothetical protein
LQCTLVLFTSSARWIHSVALVLACLHTCTAFAMSAAAARASPTNLIVPPFGVSVRWQAQRVYSSQRNQCQVCVRHLPCMFGTLMSALDYVQHALARNLVLSAMQIMRQAFPACLPVVLASHNFERVSPKRRVFVNLCLGLLMNNPQAAWPRSDFRGVAHMGDRATLANTLIPLGSCADVLWSTHRTAAQKPHSHLKSMRYSCGNPLGTRWRAASVYGRFTTQ